MNPYRLIYHAKVSQSSSLIVVLGSMSDPVPLAQLYPQRRRKPKGLQKEDSKMKVVLSRHNWGKRAQFLFILKHAYVTHSLKQITDIKGRKISHPTDEWGPGFLQVTDRNLIYSRGKQMLWMQTCERPDFPPNNWGCKGFIGKLVAPHPIPVNFNDQTPANLKGTRLGPSVNNVSFLMEWGVMFK